MAPNVGFKASGRARTSGHEPAFATGRFLASHFAMVCDNFRVGQSGTALTNLYRRIAGTSAGSM